MKQEQALKLITKVKTVSTGAYLVDRKDIVGNFEGGSHGMGIQDFDLESFNDDDGEYDFVKPIIKALKKLDNVKELYELQGYECENSVIVTKKPVPFKKLGNDSRDFEYNTTVIDSKDLKGKVLILAMDH